jgi:glycosyltransferase involved in cell wall biosynthesis
MSKIRIKLIFNGRFPSEKADSLFAVLDARSFASEGVSVEVVVPRRFGHKKDPFEFYGIKEKIELKYLPVIDLYFLPLPKSFAYFVGILSFSLSCFVYAIFSSDQNDIFYSNEILPIFPISFLRKTFYEMHDYPESKKGFFGMMIRRISKILIHNSWKTKKAIEEFGLNPNKIITLPNAVSLKEFDIATNKEQARNILNLPLNKKIVVYTGHFYSWKGVDLLALAGQDLSQYEFYFVGGNPKSVLEYKAKFTSPNLHFLGYRPHKEIPIWQKSADCLVIPNTAKEDISKYYTSPMKLFEYMASGVPIVASSIPSIMEIVSEKEVTFFEPDNKESLKDKIVRVLQDIEGMRELTTNARNKVQNYTWEKRAKKIIKFIYE